MRTTTSTSTSTNRKRSENEDMKIMEEVNLLETPLFKQACHIYNNNISNSANVISWDDIENIDRQYINDNINNKNSNNNMHIQALIHMVMILQIKL
jgi:hypothetical protein